MVMPKHELSELKLKAGGGKATEKQVKYIEGLVFQLHSKTGKLPDFFIPDKQDLTKAEASNIIEKLLDVKKEVERDGSVLSGPWKSLDDYMVKKGTGLQSETAEQGKSAFKFKKGISKEE